MKKHNGMRPHDVAILLKIATKESDNWYMKELAYELSISASEISESIHRSVFSGLIGSDKKTLKKLAILDFLKFGLQYVYPQQPGAMVRGIATSVSAPPLMNHFTNEEQFVWPYAKGNIRGQVIEPLHPKIPEACLRDKKYYELMALTDAIRIGKVREKKMAFTMLQQRLEEGA